jgi:hypothetical protein
MSLSSDYAIELEGRPTWSRERRIGHYGAALDKENSSSEGDRPYAWGLYVELRAAKGGAFRSLDSMSGLVHSECLAIARSEAARWRAGDKIRWNSEPSTSGEKVYSWAIRLGVDVTVRDTRQDIRQRCAAKWRTSAGNSGRNVDEAVESLLLGPAFVRAWRITGSDLATPPTLTFWPTVNPGPDSYNLHSTSGEAWFSERCHYIVETQRPSTMGEAEYLELVNVHLFSLLDNALSAWATFDWAEDIEDGFELDLDDLDFVGFGT